MGKNKSLAGTSTNKIIVVADQKKQKMSSERMLPGIYIRGLKIQIKATPQKVPNFINFKKILVKTII